MSVYVILKKRISIFLLLFCTFLHQLSAQNEIEEIIVSARRFPTIFNYVTVPVEVLTQEEMQEHHSALIATTLESFPGIHFANTGSLGSETTLSIRGQYQRYLKVYIDGIELSDPSGAQVSPDLTNLLSFGINRIELLRGSMGSMYGSDAISGVIDIRTELTQPESNQQKILATYGSYETFNIGYQLTSIGDNGHISLSLNRFVTEGFSSLDVANGNSEKDGHKTNSIRLGISHDLDNFRFNSALIKNDSITEYDNFDADDTFGNHIEKLQTYFMAELSSRPDKMQSQIIRFTHSNYDRIYHDENYPGDYQGNRATLEYLININNSIVIGAIWETEGAVTSDNLNADSTSLGMFANVNFNLFELNVSPSIRVEKQSSFGTNTTPSLSFSYLIKDGLKLRANLSQGYRPPSNYELYAPDVGYGPIGNINLEPEKSTTKDIGFDYKNERYNFGVNIYSLKINNLIFWEYGLGNTQSNNKAVSKGLELYANWNVSEKLKINFNLSHTESKDSNNLPLIRVPKNKARISINIDDFFHHNFVFMLSHTNKTYDMNYFNYPSEQVRLKNYTLASIQINKNITTKTRYLINLNNIIDEQYQTVYGYGSEGRSIYFGYAVNL